MELENLLSKGMSRRDFLRYSGLVLASSVVGCGGNGPSKPPIIPPPSCDIISARDLAGDYGLPDSIVDVVSNLGSICDDGPGVKLITGLLPNIHLRSNEVIARSYAERFVLDDNRFDDAELLTMERFFEGRKDREGLLVHPGYFELSDNGYVQIPNAYFMSIFEMPFRFDIFPGVYNGNKGLPIVEDNNYVSSMGSFDRSLIDNGISWQMLSEEYFNNDIVGCGVDGNFVSMQLEFNNGGHDFSINKLEVVNPLQVPVRITDIGYLVNANNVRNARVSLEPLYWPSSLGHSGLLVTMSHLDDEDIESSDLRVGSVISPEARIGRVDPDFDVWRLILSYRSDLGYFREGDENNDSRFKVIDVFDPHPHNPERRGLVWPVYYDSVRSNGIPNTMNLGVHTGLCVYDIDGRQLFGNHPDVPPMKYTFPQDAIDR